MNCKVCRLPAPFGTRLNTRGLCVDCAPGIGQRSISKARELHDAVAKALASRVSATSEDSVIEAMNRRTA